MNVYHIIFISGHFKKTDSSNPFQHYLDLEVSVPQEKLHAQVDNVLDHVVFLFKKLRHIYLVENLVDSVKVKVSFPLFIMHFISLVWPSALLADLRGQLVLGPWTRCSLCGGRLFGAKDL